MGKVLVTGFEAFGGDPLNPTELMLKWIRDDSKLSSVFDTLILPVEFSKAHELILKHQNLDSYSAILSFGLAAGRAKISLERVALNWIETSIPDNAGVSPLKGPIDPSEEKVYFTQMNIESIRDDLEAADLKTEISLTAGGYVCNHLYFQLLKAELKQPVVFIHVPYLQAQVFDKPAGTPFISESDLRKMLDVLVQSLRAN